MRPSGCVAALIEQRWTAGDERPPYRAGRPMLPVRIMARNRAVQPGTVGAPGMWMRTTAGRGAQQQPPGVPAWDCRTVNPACRPHRREHHRSHRAGEWRSGVRPGGGARNRLRPGCAWCAAQCSGYDLAGWLGPASGAPCFLYPRHYVVVGQMASRGKPGRGPSMAPTGRRSDSSVPWNA
jgi:hypothetical protein